MGSIVSDAQKTYEAAAPPGFVPTTFATATVFGGKGATIEHKDVPGLKFKGSNGIINTSIFPLAAPQLRIGSIYGTEAIVRFIAVPAISNNETARLITCSWGIGARHSISQYIPNSPVDIAAGVFYNSFTVGDLITSNGIAINATASKSIKILMLYGGLAWEKSTMNLKYNSTDPTAPPVVDVSLDGANKFRFTVGVGVSLGILKIFADANSDQ